MILRYPIAWANVAVIFSLCFVSGILSKQLGSSLMSLSFLLFFLWTQRIGLKKSFLFVISTLLMSVAYHSYISKQLEIKGKGVISGNFIFEKIFKTRPGRLGGIGHLQGNHDKTYVHIFSKLTLEENTWYYVKGMRLPLHSPFGINQNFSHYLWARGVRYHLPKVSQFRRIGNDRSPSFSQRLRLHFSNVLKMHFKNDEKAHTYEAILLGKKECLSESQLKHFLYTGTMHLFAVSGLHVGVVSTFLFFLCKALRFPKLVKLLCTFSGVLLYASIVGFSPSTLRASCMVFFVLFMQLINKPIDINAAFFNTAFFVLLLNPWQIWDVGFQLSYGVVASIIYWGVPWAKAWTQGSSYKTIDRFKSSLCISFSASIMSGLFTMYYWSLFTPWAFVTNLFLIPLTSGIVVLGSTSFIASFLCPAGVPLINSIAECFISVLLNCVHFLSNLPYAAIPIHCNSHIFYTCLFLFFLSITIHKDKGTEH